MMTRVDVSGVRVATRADGTPAFVADRIAFRVMPDNTLWISFLDPGGATFAVACLGEDRASQFITETMFTMGHNMAATGKGKTNA